MSDLAKGIIDSLDAHEGEIDHAHHARELHKHSAAILNRTHSGEPHTAEALAAFEHAYMIMKSLGLTEKIGAESEEEPANEEVANLTDVPEGHRFVLLRKEQMESNYYGGKRKLKGFVESFETAEEAYATAKLWKILPVIVAEVAQNDEGLVGQIRYMLTADALSDPSNRPGNSDSQISVVDI